MKLIYCKKCCYETIPNDNNACSWCDKKLIPSRAKRYQMNNDVRVASLATMICEQERLLVGVDNAESDKKTSKKRS